MQLYNLKNKLGIIKITGIDSAKFLQGQLTNDINSLLPAIQNGCLTHQFSAHLNHKGRILANFIIINPEVNTYCLVTNIEVIEKILPRLKMFVLRAKVEISLLDTHIFLSDHILIENNNINITLAINSYLVISNQIYESVTNDNTWTELLINHGIAFIYTETVEKLIPQQINLDILGGISFTKGCYTGQEIVARTHYLGKIKRRLFKFVVQSSLNINIGQIVISPKLDNQEVGLIVEILKLQDNSYIGLISMQADCTDSVFLDVENKIPVNIKEIN